MGLKSNDKGFVNIRNVQTWWRIFMSLFAPDLPQLLGSKISTNLENTPENGSFVVYFIH